MVCMCKSQLFHLDTNVPFAKDTVTDIDKWRFLESNQEMQKLGWYCKGVTLDVKQEN